MKYILLLYTVNDHVIPQKELFRDVAVCVGDCLSFHREHLDNLDILIRKMSYSSSAKLHTKMNPLLKAIYVCHALEGSYLQGGVIELNLYDSAISYLFLVHLNCTIYVVDSY